MAARKKNHDWLALTVEEPIEPDLPICDPHHHLWDGETARVVPRYLLDEILEDTGAGHNVVSTVFIECGAMFKPDGPEALRSVGETEFVNGIAAMSASGLYGTTRIAAGIVGTAQLRLGAAAAPVLDAQIAAGGGRFRGIRLGAAWEPTRPWAATYRPPQGMLGHDDFRAGFACWPRAASRSRPVLSPPDPRRDRAGPRLPRHHDILDHFGGPRVSALRGPGQGGPHAEWRGYISELAHLPQRGGQAGRHQH